MHSFTVFVVSVLVAQAALAAPVIAPEPAPVEEAPSLGSTIAGGIATGAALSNILNKIESLFKRDRSSPLSDDDKKQILVALVNKAAQVSQAQKRTLRQSIVEGAADGATGAISDNANPLITELLNEIESHINIREVDSRGLVSSGANAAIGAGASAGTHSIVSTILDKIESLFKRDDWGQDFQGVGPAKREPVPLPLPSGDPTSLVVLQQELVGLSSRTS